MMKILYVIHTSPKRIEFVKKYMVPCLLRYEISGKNIVVWNDENMDGQLKAWTDCAEWLDEKSMCDGVWHLEDDVIPCKKFKIISEKMAEQQYIVQGFTTNCKFSDFKGKTGILTVKDLPYGMQCIYIPNFYLRGFVDFVNSYVYTGMYRKRQFECGTLYSDAVFRAFLRRYHKNSFINVLDDCMVEHVDYLIGGRSVNEKNVDRRARKFNNYEEVERLRRELKA